MNRYYEKLLTRLAPLFLLGALFTTAVADQASARVVLTSVVLTAATADAEPAGGSGTGAETVPEGAPPQTPVATEPSWPQWPQWALPLLEDDAFQEAYEVDRDVNPFFLSGDWDNDGLLDLAVVVRARDKEERGVVLLRQASAQTEVFGAGDEASSGGADWGWLEAWKVESVLPAGVTVQPAGDALILGDVQEVAGWLLWDGQQWQWVP